MRAMRLDNTPSKEDMKEAAKAIGFVEVILDCHLGTTEVCPICVSKHIIQEPGVCSKG